MTDLLKGVRGFKFPDPLKRWAEPADVPYAETVDFDEVSIDELKLKRARSFRADLYHKLNILIRAFGGICAASRECHCHRTQFSRWLNGHDFPRWNYLHVIDNRYALALEILIEKKRFYKKKHQREKAARDRKLKQAIEEAQKFLV